MIYSMTGFGSGRVEAANLVLLVDLKSVNHRYLDLHLKLPGEFQSLENLIRQKVAGAIKRGRVDAFVRIDYKRENIRLEVNRSMIRAYADLMSELKNSIPIQGELTFEMIAALPGAITLSTEDLTTDEIELIRQKAGEAVDVALAQLKGMRASEGETLIRDINRRIDNIGRRLETIASGAGEFVEHYRQQLIKRVTELAPELAVNSSRLEMEALLYAEKSDVTEEITRLRSHLHQFASLRTLGDEAGKRMDFILQEMNREVTTILSKTSGLDNLGVRIGEAALEIKVEIEKLREQVQNIE